MIFFGGLTKIVTFFKRLLQGIELILKYGAFFGGYWLRKVCGDLLNKIDKKKPLRRSLQTSPRASSRPLGWGR